MLIDRGSRDSEVWSEISDLAEQRRRLAASESKRRLDGRHAISLQEVVFLMRTIAMAITNNVSDVAVRRRVLQEISGLQLLLGTGQPPPPTLDHDAPSDEAAT